MYKLLKKYNSFIIFTLIIFIFINIIKNILNIYTFLLFILICTYFYKKNKRLFKKILLKLFFNNNTIIRLNNKYSAAKKSLIGISEINELVTDKVNSEIINYEKNRIENQLKNGNYNVILFGAGSCGKTSLARAILKRMVGNTSPAYGTTKKIKKYTINIAFLKRKVNIVDTPGLFESSLEGEKRERETILNASKSDLIIFVIDQDINKYELYLLNELSNIGKSIILVLNKCDLRSSSQNKLIKDNLINITSKSIKNIKIIQTIASPQSQINDNNILIKRDIEVESLFYEMINILESNGEELLADNVIFQCNKLGYQSKNIINKQREKSAKKIINKYAWVTSGVIILNPLPAADYLAASAINVQMVLEVAKIYGIKLTKENALELTKKIIGVLTTLGIVKSGLNLITNFLSLNFTTQFINKSAQAITAAWIIRIVGLSFIEYFQQNQNWGDGGIIDVVQNVYNINKKEEILNNFIEKAINKLKKTRISSPRKKLPPYLQND